MKQHHILVIEDEVSIRDLLACILSENPDYIVTLASHTQEAERQIRRVRPDLILLDWMLPLESGIAFVRRLKASSHLYSIPIMLLTAKAEEENKVMALELGADDYITKPFSPRELMARIKNVLRRGVLISKRDEVVCGPIRLHLASQAVWVHEKPIMRLTALNYRLLYCLIRHRGRVCSRTFLLDQIWGRKACVNERTVDTQVKRLRKALLPYGVGDAIESIRGVGYCWVITSAQASQHKND